MLAHAQIKVGKIQELEKDAKAAKSDSKLKKSEGKVQWWHQKVGNKTEIIIRLFKISHLCANLIKKSKQTATMQKNS